MTDKINPKKRILFIITQSEMGGAQRFLFKLLSNIGVNFDIMVATGIDGGSELSDKLGLLNIGVVKLKKLKRNISPIEDIKACFEIRDLINKFKPDTLFLLSSKAGFIGSLTSNFLIPSPYRPKIIYRIGGWSFNDPRPAWERKLWIKLERLSAKWKDIIILNNSHDFEQAEKLKIKPKINLVLVHNGIDPYELSFLPRDEAQLKLFEKISRISGKVFHTQTIIGTVANLYPTKGISNLVQAAEYFKKDANIIFVVIGDGSEKIKIEEMIREKGLEKKIFILGQIRDGYRYMSAFDIFVLPSVKEGFPFAILEAMSAKLPIIATRVGAIPEIIENGKNGFIIEPNNPAGIDGKIKDILASNHLYKEFSIQGHQTVLFKFSEDKMIKEIEPLL